MYQDYHQVQGSGSNELYTNNKGQHSLSGRKGQETSTLLYLGLWAFQSQSRWWWWGGVLEPI